VAPAQQSRGAEEKTFLHECGERGIAVVATLFPDSNKKYLSTDLMAEEPQREGYFSPEVELLGVQAIGRVCTCARIRCRESVEPRRVRAPSRAGCHVLPGLLDNLRSRDQTNEARVRSQPIEGDLLQVNPEVRRVGSDPLEEVEGLVRRASGHQDRCP
jgi:hypothetical protein